MIKICIKSTHTICWGLLLLFSACTTDYGIEPLPGKLRVRVVYQGERPADTQGVYLVVAPEFPPHAINELYHSPNSLAFDRDTVWAELDLPYGHYDAYMLWWYSTDRKSNLADILSMSIDLTSKLPESFDLTADNPVYEARLNAHWGAVKRDSRITGTVTFNGPFPPNTSAVAVAAYEVKPVESIDYLIFLKSIDFSVETNPHHFDLPITSGMISYIAVFWLPERAALTDFRTLGFYRDPRRPEREGRVFVSSGQIISGIDIEADWSLVRESAIQTLPGDGRGE
ncbi:hypothetical protein JW992_08225 [candidate division KSB1 bacterium]|nr:hypothetical protein [candidate division KSB1 bacterium]